MSAVPFHCPHCGGLFQTDPSLAGRHAACPHCAGVVAIPESAPLPSPSDVPPTPSSGPAAPATDPALQYACPVCHGPFQVSRTMGGQQVYCPHCNTAVLLPTFEAAPPGPNRPGVSNSGFPGAEELAALSKAAAARTERRPQSDLPHEPPTEPRAPTKATRAGDGSILIPGDGGGYIALREPSKTIAAHGRQIELRRLSPEEKARRRFRRNWLVAGFGLVFLVIALLAMGVLRGGL